MWRKTNASSPTNFVTLGASLVEVRRLSAADGLQLLFVGAPLWSKVHKQMAPEELFVLAQENLGPLFELVSRTTGRSHLWLHQNATLPQMMEAIKVADRVNEFTPCFELVRQMGWVRTDRG